MYIPEMCRLVKYLHVRKYHYVSNLLERQKLAGGCTKPHKDHKSSDCEALTFRFYFNILLKKNNWMQILVSDMQKGEKLQLILKTEGFAEPFSLICVLLSPRLKRIGTSTISYISVSFYF
uniref:Uncharacterized protein n=1 Tax=Nothobranchius furzeri TaxID=105023 RepID=A0A1A7ZMM5_NOTFU